MTIGVKWHLLLCNMVSVYFRVGKSLKGYKTIVSIRVGKFPLKLEKDIGAFDSRQKVHETA